MSDPAVSATLEHAHPAATSLAPEQVRASTSLAPLPPAGGAGGGSEPQGLFTRERQVAFLHALAGSGGVRQSSAAVGISYRTVYRERRASPGFRRAWDAALLSARALHEDVLAARAIDGVEEEVLYHGEVVATRRRYDARLLLAHLARLDRLTEDARTRAWSDDFEGALERFAAGSEDPAPVCTGCGAALALRQAQGERGEGGDFSSAGLCDTCDTRPALAEPEAADADGIAPPLPTVRERGQAVSEAVRLGIGDYEVWWDEEGERDLTTWPAPDDFAGEELAIHENDGAVLGPWPLDPAAPGAGRCYWARTLTPAEEDGRAEADTRQADHRAARRALYQRAAFGLASPAELASLAAANPGNPEWEGRDPAPGFAG